MSDRERLIELLGHAQYLGGLEEKIADHLIANGVTVQKHGRWVLKERAHYFKCSLCKEPIAYKFGYANSRRYYNYCPHCGAKMDGEA